MSKVDVLAVMSKIENKFTCSDFWDVSLRDMQEARAAVAELIEDANRWRAVMAVYAGFQTRGDKMAAYISTPQWVGDWPDFNNAIDRHFEINGAALANIGGAS